MRIRPRRSAPPAQATPTGTLRIAGSTDAALAEVEPGQVLVVDLTDLDYTTAEAIAQAEVSAVVNLGRLVGGRYANLGPAALAETNLVWIDDVGSEAADRLVDGTAVRLDRGEVHLIAPAAGGSDAGGPVAVGREVDLAALARTAPVRPAEAHVVTPSPPRRPSTPATPGPRLVAVPEPVTPEPVNPEAVTPEPPEPPTSDPTTPEPTTPEPATPEPATPEPATPEPATPERATAEPVVAEAPAAAEDPAATEVAATSDIAADAVELRTTIEDRPVVVMVMATASHQDLRALRRFIRNASSVFVAVGEPPIEDLIGLGCVPDIVVREAAAPDDLPSEELLAMARDVVLVGEPGETDDDTIGADGSRPIGQDFQRVESAESAVTIALRLVEQRGASVVVGAGLPPAETRLGTVPFLNLSAVASLSTPRRLASIVALVLALVVGGALGAGALVAIRGPSDSAGSAAGSSAALIDAERQIQASERSAQSMVSAVGPRVYGTGLTGHAVVVVGLPGTSATEVTHLSDQVRTAGGAASRSVTLQRQLIDPADQSEVDTVGAGLVTQLADPRLTADATTYVRLGQLLALAMTTTGTVSAVADPTAVTIRDALQSAGLARFPTDMRLAPMVLLVLPSDDSASSAGTALLTDLVNGLATTASSVVVVGDTVTGQPGGALADLRAQTLSDRVSTVDGIDRPTGVLSTVLTLEAALTGITGAYGASGADGPVPATA